MVDPCENQCTGVRDEVSVQRSASYHDEFAKANLLEPSCISDEMLMSSKNLKASCMQSLEPVLNIVDGVKL